MEAHVIACVFLIITTNWYEHTVKISTLKDGSKILTIPGINMLIFIGVIFSIILLVIKTRNNTNNHD